MAFTASLRGGIRSARRVQRGRLHDELARLPVKPESTYSVPQTRRLQQPDAYHNHYYDIQNRLDAGRHRYIPVDQVQRYADDDQDHHNI